MIAHGDQIITSDADDGDLTDAEHEVIITQGERIFHGVSTDRAQMFAVLRAAALIIVHAALLDDDPRDVITGMAEDIAHDAESIWLVALAQQADLSGPSN